MPGRKTFSFEPFVFTGISTAAAEIVRNNARSRFDSNRSHRQSNTNFSHPIDKILSMLVFFNQSKDIVVSLPLSYSITQLLFIREFLYIQKKKEENVFIIC